MLRLVRFALLVVLFFWIAGLVMTVGRSETGPIEDTVLVLGIVGLFGLAISVRRIGAPGL